MALAHPLVTEKAMVLLENSNQLSKAIITFEENNAAEEILSQLGIV